MLQAIKQAHKQFRLNKQSACAQVLTTLLGEVSTVEKSKGSLSNEDIIAKIKYFIKCNVDNIETGLLDIHQIAALEEENKVLSQFLPVQLSETALTELLQKYLATDNSMGALKLLKADCAGCYDGAQAAKICKALLGE